MGIFGKPEQKPAEAADEFQKIISHRGIVVEDPIDALARVQLARALAASGDLPFVARGLVDRTSLDYHLATRQGRRTRAWPW